nr:outer membrane beta-barrel protein [Nitrospirota bacterium]
MTVAIAALFSFLWPLSDPVGAEWYVGGFGGVTTQELITNATISRNFQGIGPVNNAKVSDIDLIDSLTLGGKAGYYLESKKWLGFEGEVFWSRPSIKQQAINVAAPDANGGQSFARTIPGRNLNMTIASLSVLTRDTTMGKFQPYAGVGVGFTYTGYDLVRSTLLTPGLMIQAGGRYFLDDRLAVFGEFKYFNSELTYAGISGNFTAQYVVFGISYHFNQPDKTEPQGLLTIPGL